MNFRLGNGLGRREAREGEGGGERERERERVAAAEKGDDFIERIIGERSAIIKLVLIKCFEAGGLFCFLL